MAVLKRLPYCWIAAQAEMVQQRFLEKFALLPIQNTEHVASQHATQQGFDHRRHPSIQPVPGGYRGKLLNWSAI
jgi:hypothetical protein